MADCAGTLMQVAVMEDGSAQVYLPVENWRDVKAVRTVGQYEGAVRVLHADDQVRIYGGPSGAMVDVCIDFLSDGEKAERDRVEREAAEASVAELHDARVEDAQLQVEQAADQAQVVAEAADDKKRPEVDAEAKARAEQRLQDAEAEFERAQAEREAAIKAVTDGE